MKKAEEENMKKNRNCNMTEEEKERKRKYARNRYHMMIKVC